VAQWDVVLLILIYYLGGGALVDQDVSSIGVGAAVGLGVAVMVIGWVAYDLLMLSPLDGTKKRLH